MSCHPLLGRSQALAEFLAPTYAGIPDRTTRKGLFAKLAESFAGSSQPTKMPTHDIEEFFENERDWANNYSAHLKTVLNAVLTVVHVEKSKLRHVATSRSASDYGVSLFGAEITGQLKHLCTALTMSSPSYPAATSLVHYQLHSKMAESFLSIEVCVPRPPSVTANHDNGVSLFHQDLIEEGLQRGLCDFYCIWDLYHQYVTSEQLTLNRRTALLISYEHANRHFDKSKAHRKDEVSRRSN